MQCNYVYFDTRETVSWKIVSRKITTNPSPNPNPNTNSGENLLGWGNLPGDKFSGLCLFQKFKNKKNKKLNAMLSLQKIILKRASCLSWLTIVMLAFKCRNEDCANVSANAINKLQQKKDLDIFLGEIYFWDKSWIVTRECGDKSWGKFTSIRIYRNSFICYFNLW